MAKIIPKPRRMTPELLEELIRIHSTCVHDQERKCPLLICVQALCWEINQPMGVADEADKGLKRHDPMCAARPLTTPFVHEEEE